MAIVVSKRNPEHGKYTEFSVEFGDLKRPETLSVYEFKTDGIKPAKCDNVENEEHLIAFAAAPEGYRLTFVGKTPYPNPPEPPAFADNATADEKKKGEAAFNKALAEYEAAVERAKAKNKNIEELEARILAAGKEIQLGRIRKAEDHQKMLNRAADLKRKAAKNKVKPEVVPIATIDD